jgi:lactoylglutathione lyase
MENAKAIFKNSWPYQKDKMNLPVSELESSLLFYETVMQFRVASRINSPIPSAILERDGIQIGLAENGGDPAQDGCFFEVDNVEAAKDR